MSGALTVGVTGATGYIGGLVAERLRTLGHQVVALGRHPVAAAGLSSRRLVLGEPVPEPALAGLDALVHCAWDLAAVQWEDVERVNVQGSRALLDAAQAAGVQRVLFVSSMSAYEGTRQAYGLSKLAVEELVTARGGHSVRLGLVYGGAWGGMAGALRTLGRLPVVPVIGSRSHQFTCHADDVAAGLATLVTHPSPPPAGVLGLAHPTPVPFRTVLREFAQADGGRAPRLVPVPWAPVYASMRLAERTGVRLPLRSDSVLGLVRPAPSVPRVHEWAELGVPLRALV